MSNKKLKIARNKIDKIDKLIFNLIKKRSNVVKYMLSLKKYKNEIIDRKRISVILRKIKKNLLRIKLIPELPIESGNL